MVAMTTLRFMVIPPECDWLQPVTDVVAGCSWLVCLVCCSTGTNLADRR
jgi:hypothetical protein